MCPVSSSHPLELQEPVKSDHPLSPVSYSFGLREGARKGPVVLDFQTGNISQPVQDISFQEVQIPSQRAVVPELSQPFRSAGRRAFNKGKRRVEETTLAQSCRQKRCKHTTCVADDIHIIPGEVGTSSTVTIHCAHLPSDSDVPNLAASGEVLSQIPKSGTANVSPSFVHTVMGMPVDGQHLPATHGAQRCQQRVGQSTSEDSHAPAASSSAGRGPHRRRNVQPPLPTPVHAQACGPLAEYKAYGPCNCVCSNCHARFWYEERLSISTQHSGPLYNRCCRGGTVMLFTPREYLPYIQQLFKDNHFIVSL